MKINKLELKSKVQAGDLSNKLKNKQDEVEFLEKADLDSLSKRIFANRYTINDLEKSGDRLSLEDRIVIRLFSFDKIHKEIIDFRLKHSDWEELVDVVLYKNTCGKMKVNKKTDKKKSSKIAVTIPLAYGIQEIDVSKEESKKIFIAPQVEKRRKKNESTAIISSNNNEDEKDESKSDRKNMEKTKLFIKETFDVSDEKIREFIKTQDDLDEWERNENSGDDNEEEFDLMKPLMLSGRAIEIEKSEPTKKTKKATKQKKIIKRKFPFETKPKIWKKIA